MARPTEIELTQEMIEAASDLLWRWNPENEHPSAVVIALWEMLINARNPAPPIKKEIAAVQMLRDALQSGPVPSAEVKRSAKESGITNSTLRRAKDKLLVRAIRVGGIAAKGSWVWKLPPSNERHP